MMFETNPCNKSSAEGEVEKTFVGKGEDDKGWRKCEEDDDEAMEVVVVWVETVEEWHSQ